MTKLLEKVSTITSNMEKENTKPTDSKFEKEQSTRKSEEIKTEEKFEETQNTRRSQALNQSQTLGDYLEDFKKNITVYLENILSQNQTIISENNRLKQNLDNYASNQPSRRQPYHETSYQSPGYAYPPFQQNEPTPRDIEKIVDSLIERNLRSWENIFYSHVKSQNEVLEERINSKINNAVYDLKEREELLKKKLFEEIAKLQNQRESAIHQNRTPVPKSSNFLSVEDRDRSNTNRGKYEVRHVNKDVTGVDLDVSLTQRGQLITDETQLDLGLDKRTQKISEGKQADQKSATRNNIQKVQYLMEQLQAKNALKNKKGQGLQKEKPLSLNPHKDNFGV